MAVAPAMILVAPSAANQSGVDCSGSFEPEVERSG